MIPILSSIKDYVLLWRKFYSVALFFALLKKRDDLAKVISDKKINLGARGLVVMTSLSHSEGRRFKSGRAHKDEISGYSVNCRL